MQNYSEQMQFDKSREMTEKRTYTVQEIQSILGISTPSAYILIRKNYFKCIKVGRVIRVSKKSFDKWLDEAEVKYDV